MQLAGALLHVRAPRSSSGALTCSRRFVAVPAYISSTQAMACVDRHVRRIQDQRVGGGLERRRRPARVARVALPDIAQKTFNV